MKSDCTGLENGVICRTHPCAPNELSSSQFYTLDNRVSSLMHGFNWATNYCRHLWNKIYLLTFMFTLILQSILQDNNRWADVGKNLIDETPFVWPVLTYKMAQDYKVLMLIYNTACETSHVLKRLQNSD